MQKLATKTRREKVPTCTKSSLCNFVPSSSWQIYSIMEMEHLYQLYLQHPHVQTDSRKLKEGEIFFALKGPNFNGNAFAVRAIELGASYVIVDEPVEVHDPRIILVPDVLNSLQQLAKYHRGQFDKLPGGGIPFIAITGSNGKTTTKELIHQVLSRKYITYTTEGNLNNHIGIPLTLLKVRMDAQVVVIEMGANHLKEIRDYCTYANPTHGLITNCGKAHLEGFGSVEGVRKGKGELYDHLRANKGTVFVNANDQVLLEMAKGIPEIIYYGDRNGSIKTVPDKEDSFVTVSLDGFTKPIHSRLVGNYNLHNILAAIAIGEYFKVPKEQIQNAIEQYIPSNSRSQLVKVGTNTFIMDAYNANPSSMRSAIENFAAMKVAGDKILLLGSMMELGKDSGAEHKDIVRLIDQYQWGSVALVGEGFKSISDHYLVFENAYQVRNWLDQQQVEHATLLVKGSRSMEMENVLSPQD